MISEVLHSKFFSQILTAVSTPTFSACSLASQTNDRKCTLIYTHTQSRTGEDLIGKVSEVNHCDQTRVLATACYIKLCGVDQRFQARRVRLSQGNCVVNKTLLLLGKDGCRTTQSNFYLPCIFSGVTICSGHNKSRPAFSQCRGLNLLMLKHG